MRKVKLFKSVESELESLESDINDWLSSTGNQLISITGNISPQTPTSSHGLEHFPTSDLFVIVLYEEPNG